MSKCLVLFVEGDTEVESLAKEGIVGLQPALNFLQQIINIKGRLCEYFQSGCGFVKGVKMSKKNHLPLYGVGPIIVYGQFIFTAISIILTHVFDLKFPMNNVLNMVLKIMGILLIASGIYLDLSAKLKSKLFKNVEDNKLITDGVYSIVRNPVYSGALLACTGAILIANNLILLIVPVICWMYMTIFLMKTEEKWLEELYGEEYVLYCKRVNRCIPWFPKKK